MGLDKEAQEFNEKQKRLQEYYQTEGRGLDRLEKALTKLQETIDKHMGFLIDTILKYIEDQERRQHEADRRSSHGLYDPFKYRTQRGSDSDRWSAWATSRMRDEPYRNPYKRHRGDPPPYDPDKDDDPDIVS